MATSNSPAETFRSNLHRLSAAQDLDCDGLAAALDFTRDQKKWLWRAWEDGLSRHDKRTSKRLWKLVRFFGVESPGELWKPDVEIDPERLRQTNLRSWVLLVDQIQRYLRIIERLRRGFPDEFTRIEEKYEFNVTLMVASWMNDEWNSGGDSDLERSMVESMRSQVERGEHNYEAWKRTHEQSLQVRLRKLLEAHPKWNHFCSRLRQHHGDHALDSEIDVRLTRAFRQRASLEEAHKRFIESCLREQTNEYSFSDETMVIVENLKDHPNWTKWVEWEFDGNIDAAITHVDSEWRRIGASGNIGPAQFYKGFEVVNLEGYSPEV